MRTGGFHLSTTWLCVLLVACFQAGIWLLPPPVPIMSGLPPAVRDYWPHLQMAGGRVDIVELRKSVLRLPSSVGLRETANSLRLTFGEFPQWTAYGRRRTPMFFLYNEMLLAPGLTPENRQLVERAASVIGDLNRHFRAENWKMVVLPVPTKLSTYRENVDWPIRKLDTYSNVPLPADRTDALCDLLFARLAGEGVVAVDLRKSFRKVALADDGRFVFPPGESHWTGLGIRLAAEQVADALAALGLPRSGSCAQWVPYKESSDLSNVLDHLHFWPPSLRKLLYFPDTIERGHKPPPNPAGLRAVVALAGTSYSGQYTWLGDAGLGASLDCRLPDALIKSFVEAGRGSLRTAQSFIEGKTGLLQELAATEFSEHQITYDQKYFVWEFPVRDLRGFLAPPQWIPSGNIPLVQDNSVVAVDFADGFQKQETSAGVNFRWVRQKATLRVHAVEAGRYRLTMRPVTMFSTQETTVAVLVNGHFAGALSSHATDFQHAAPETIEADLQAGDNAVTLESNRNERLFGPSDPRLAAFGLILPITMEAIP